MADFEHLFNSKLLKIKSEDRKSGTPGDFTVNLGNESYVQQVVHIVPLSVSLLHSFYNVNSLTNTFKFTNSTDGLQTINLTNKQYNVNQLITELQTQMNAVMSDTIAITYDTQTRKITFTITGASTNIYYADDDPSNASSLSRLLGITSTSSTLGTYTSESQIDLGGVKQINIISDTLGDNNAVNSNASLDDLIINIPVEAEFGAEISWQNEADHISVGNTFDNPRGIQNIDIRLTDQDDNPLQIEDHLKVHMMFKIYYSRA